MRIASRLFSDPRFNFSDLSLNAMTHRSPGSTAKITDFHGRNPIIVAVFMGKAAMINALNVELERRMKDNWSGIEVRGLCSHTYTASRLNGRCNALFRAVILNRELTRAGQLCMYRNVCNVRMYVSASSSCHMHCVCRYRTPLHTTAKPLAPQPHTTAGRRFTLPRCATARTRTCSSTSPPESG